MEENHNVVLENRSRLSVSDVEEVISFNENEVKLSVNNSLLIIKGINLRVEEVSKQSREAVIESECIDSLTYTKHSGNNKESVIRRLFK